MSDNKTPATGTLMKGKRGLVLGVATKRSNAYGIAGPRKAPSWQSPIRSISWQAG